MGDGFERTGAGRRSVYVPLRRRAARFLEALAESGNATLAGEAAGIGRDRLYRLRREDAEFAVGWEKALEAFRERAEAEEGLAELGGLAGADGLVVRRGRGGRAQLVSARANLWSARKEEAFLATFAATGNVTAAARAAGVSAKAAWARRLGCAGFAERFEAARAAALDALELMLMEEGAKAMEAAEGARADPSLAMWLIARRDKAAAGARAGTQRQSGRAPRAACDEEVTAALEKRLRAYSARLRAKEAGGETGGQG